MILLFGKESQKRKYLPPLCKGDAISGTAVTEPDAGSDVLSVSTRAEKKDGGYVINGTKQVEKLVIARQLLTKKRINVLGW